MRYNLLRKEMREGFWKFIIGTALLVILAAALPMLFEFIVDMFKEVPDEFRSFMPDIPIMENHNYYLWSQWNAKNLYQVGTILAILLGMNVFAGEVSRGTAGFLMTRPITRAEVFITKASAGAVMLFLIVFLSTLALILSAVIEFGTVDVGRLVVATIITIVGLLVIYSFSLLISVLIDEPVKAGAVSALGVFLSAVPGWFPKTTNFSLFTHITATEYFTDGNLPVVELLVMVLLITIFLYVSLYKFSEKEF